MDPRQKAILHAAWQAFAAYGFRKTSMDDIARGAGMSRPALYLHYRNKEDIFRSLAEYYYADAAASVRAALDTDGAVPERLARAFAAQGGGIVEAMLTSPHGLELLDTKTTTASEIAERGEAVLAGIYRDWLDRVAAAGEARLDRPAEEIALAITAALRGIKSGAASYPDYARDINVLGWMIGRGLLP
jgi:AcrR family transcriptional regulator